MQNRSICVKCSADGELPLKRKAAGRLFAVYVPHPLQQKLWHPVCEGAGFTCGAIRIESFFVLRGKEKETRMDQKKIEEGVRLILEGIGEDIHREGLVETPKRVARMCELLYGGLTQDAREHLEKQFHVENNNMVLEKDIPFYSTCEHHLLPFYGKAHVAYIPNGTVAGLSKLARTVEVFARRPQLQEQMTAQIADAMETCLHAKGVMVMIEAEHMCMTMRGVQKPGTKTVTTVVRGAFAEDYCLQQTFLQMVK